MRVRPGDVLELFTEDAFAGHVRNVGNGRGLGCHGGDGS